MNGAKTDISQLPINQVLCGDCVEIMKTFPDERVDMTMFSPPYWGLRDYGVDKQIGLEDNPSKYVAKMVEICREVKRLLKNTGSMYIVVGDTYFGSMFHDTEHGKKGREGSLNARNDFFEPKQKPWNFIKDSKWLQPKQLLGIPWRVAIALQEDGWILRNDIIWNKPNHMPSSVKDRLTNAYEHIFFFVKRRKYYYDLDAIREKHKCAEEMEKYRNEPRVAKAKRFRRRESHFQLVPTESPHRTSKDVIGRYEGKYNGQQVNPSEGHIRRGAEFAEAKEEGTAFHPLGKNPSDVYFGDRHHWRNEDTIFGSNRGKEGHPEGKNPSDVLLYDSKYAKHEYGQTLQAFVREQTIVKRRILSRAEAEKLFPNDPKKQQEYINYIHDHDAHSSGKNPADFWNINTQPFKGAHFAVYP